MRWSAARRRSRRRRRQRRPEAAAAAAGRPRQGRHPRRRPINCVPILAAADVVTAADAAARHLPTQARQSPATVTLNRMAEKRTKKKQTQTTPQRSDVGRQLLQNAARAPLASRPFQLAEINTDC